jgi:hypothetical protein
VVDRSSTVLPHLPRQQFCAFTPGDGSSSSSAKATDLVERERLWQRLELLWPNYQVLSAWTDLMHVAYVFTTEGHESLLMDDIGFFTSSG